MGYVLQLKWNIFDICWTLMAFSPVLWCTKKSVTIIAVQKLLINESKKYGVLATYLLPIVLNLLISGEGKTQILRAQPRRWGGPLRCLALTLQNLWQITCNSDLDLGPSFPRWVTTSYFSLQLFSWMHQNVKLQTLWYPCTWNLLLSVMDQSGGIQENVCQPDWLCDKTIFGPWWPACCKWCSIFPKIGRYSLKHVCKLYSTLMTQVKIQVYIHTTFWGIQYSYVIFVIFLCLPCVHGGKEP